MSDGLLMRAGHLALRAAVAPGKHAFVRGAGAIEAIQRRKLAALLWQVAAVDGRIDPRWGWEEFRNRVPVTRWQDWAGMVERQRDSRARLLIDSPAMRYQPTSGSTSAIKWIPYTRHFLAELDAAVSPWLGDLYQAFPGVRQGRHYWSLSWLPTPMRAHQSGDLNDDMTLLSSVKRLLAGLTQAVPQEAALAHSSEGSLFITLAFLAADSHLSALSVWSPTFALNLLERLGSWRHELAEVLSRGDWGAYAAGASSLRCPRAPRVASLLREWDGSADPHFHAALWPRLALVSAWDTAAAVPWAARLREQLPQAAFQGKGLWATEGVVTIPFQGRHVLAYRSHVYEFEDRDSGRILAPWELREGQCVSPLLSTGSGLLRYRMNDILRVGGFLRSVPALEFVGRDDGTDLVGEKLAATFVQSVLDSLDPGGGLLPLTLLALDDAGGGRPGYVLLLEQTRAAGGASAPTDALARQLDLALGSHFHYQLARNLGQLAPAQAVAAPAMRALYAEQCLRNGMIEGNIKVEPLRHWRGGLPVQLAGALRARADSPWRATAGEGAAAEVSP